MDAALHLAGWYLALAAIGACGLLPAALLFEHLATRGVLYARPLALALVAIATWLLGWSGGVGYGTGTVLGAVAALALCSALIAVRRPEVLRAVRARWRTILAGEALLVTVWALLVLARAQAPDAVGTEKPMDLMLLTAVHRASAFPPPDPWLAGHTLAYYHLGHLAMDILGRLSGNAPGVTFTLATATVGGLAAAAAAGVAADATGLAHRPGRRAPLVAAAAAVALLLLVAPLVGVVNLAAANGIGDRGWWAVLGVEGVPIAEGARGGVPSAFWWWWTTTRVLPGTISEYPAFTLLIGDPHAHLLALPIDLVAVALAVATFEGGTPLSWRAWLGRPAALVLTAAVFAAIVMTNPWDIMVYGGLWGGAGIAATRRTGWNWGMTLFSVACWVAVPAGVAGFIAWPFLETLDAPPIGLAPVIGEHSDPVRWLLVWAPLLLVAGAAMVRLWPRAPRAAILPVARIVALPVAAWGGAVLGDGASELAARGSGWVVIAGLAAAVALLGGMALAADGRADRSLAVGLALVAASLGVLLLTELVRVADAFPGRLNTVFKLWLNAWVLLAVGGGVLVGLAALRPPPSRGARIRGVARATAALAIGLVVLTTLTAPAIAVSRAREGQVPGLDATAYLRREDPGLAAVIAWAGAHLDPARDGIVQAVGESYGPGNMLASASGVPAPLAWANHERQWRRSVPEHTRDTAVAAIYDRGATPEAAAIARGLGATHVYVGREERARYGIDVTERFAAWTAVVEEDGALLVKVP